jgi:hypothetical protein
MRVLIAIQSCVAHVDRLRACFETWAKEPTDFDIMAFDGPLLGVADDYEHLPEKTKAMMWWARQRDYDYLFKADTDIYLSLSRLANSGFENYDYSGHVQDWIPGHLYCSGPHYWVSRKAIQILTDADWSEHCVFGHNIFEDVRVGEVLVHHGITPHHDPRYSNHEWVLPGNDNISCHLSDERPFRLEAMYRQHVAFHGL